MGHTALTAAQPIPKILPLTAGSFCAAAADVAGISTMAPFAFGLAGAAMPAHLGFLVGSLLGLSGTLLANGVLLAMFPLPAPMASGSYSAGA